MLSIFRLQLFESGGDLLQSYNMDFLDVDEKFFIFLRKYEETILLTTYAYIEFVTKGRTTTQFKLSKYTKSKQNKLLALTMNGVTHNQYQS